MTEEKLGNEDKMVAKEEGYARAEVQVEAMVKVQVVAMVKKETKAGATTEREAP